MKIIITRNCSVGGQSVTASDKPVEYPDDVARQLIAANKAVRCQSPEKTGK